MNDDPVLEQWLQGAYLIRLTVGGHGKKNRSCCVVIWLDFLDENKSGSSFAVWFLNLEKSCSNKRYMFISLFPRPLSSGL